jgi:integrase
LKAWHSQTPYADHENRGFAIFTLKARQPSVGNMIVEDYLRPAPVAAGVLKEGGKIRFGFHNLRHSLATFLVHAGTNPTTIQGLLRHADVTTTLRIYSHG